MTTETLPPIVQIESPVALAEALADTIVERLTDAINTQGSASLVVSGGSTPKPLFEALRVRDLPWSKVSITLADERWVPESDADSNAAFVKSTLLQDKAAAAKFISLYIDGASPEEGVGQVHTNLQGLAQPITVLVLGMGGDGHTASLFPDAPGTERAMVETESLVSIVKPTTVPQARITLTLPALMNASCQLLHITGAQKRELLDGVLENPASSGYPIAKFMQRDNDLVSVYTTH